MVKDWKVIYPDNTEEFKRRVAKIIIDKIGQNAIKKLIEKIKGQNRALHY